MISARAVSFAYPGRPPAVDNIDLRLAGTGRVALLGTSGSGKSTLALCLAGLLHPTTGTVTVDGADAGTARRLVTSRVGLLFQNPESQILTGRVADEVALPLENLGWSRSAIERRVVTLLEGLGLAHLATRNPRRLSGGETQRVALAAALAPDPRALLLDEPLAHLDGEAALEVESWLEKIGIGVRTLRLDLSPMPARGAERESCPIGRSLVVDHGRLVHDGGSLPAGLVAALAGEDTPVAAEPGWWRPVVVGNPLRATGLVLEAGGRTLTRGLDLELHPGRVIALTGPSGSGKSTLLKTLAGWLEPAGGRLDTGGDPRARISYVPQYPERLFWRPTVADELAAGGSELDRVLELVGLDRSLLERSPYRLSGGERRRVALAAALARRHPILLLDEPAAGLDGPGRLALSRLVRVVAEAGGAVLLVAHDPDILALGDPVLELRRGGLRARSVSGQEGPSASEASTSSRTTTGVEARRLSRRAPTTASDRS